SGARPLHEARGLQERDVHARERLRDHPEDARQGLLEAGRDPRRARARRGRAPDVLVLHARCPRRDDGHRPRDPRVLRRAHPAEPHGALLHRHSRVRRNAPRAHVQGHGLVRGRRPFVFALLVRLPQARPRRALRNPRARRRIAPELDDERRDRAEPAHGGPAQRRAQAARPQGAALAPPPRGVRPRHPLRRSPAGPPSARARGAQHSQPAPPPRLTLTSERRSLQPGFRRELARAGDLLERDLRVVGRVEPLDLELAAGEELLVVAEELVARIEGAALARLELVVLLLAREHQAAVALAELVVLNVPLAGAGVEVPDATARNHDVELVPLNAADVDDLDDHPLVADPRRALIVGLAVGLAGELQLVALPALPAVECG